MKKLLYSFLVILTLYTGSLQAESKAPDIERVIWDYTPISITLQVGKERRIFFPPGVRVKVFRPDRLSGTLRHQSTDNVVYWQAYDAFDVARITVEDIDTQAIYLIDLSADEIEQSSVPVQILRRTPRQPLRQSGASQGEEAAKTRQTPLPSPDEIWLTRYAVQILHPPARVVSDINSRIPGVMRTTVPKNRYKLYQDGTLSAQPVAGWKTDRFYITAVRLGNLTEQTIEIDPRQIRGTFKTTSFERKYIAPKGQPHDFALVYLLSTQPYKASTRMIEVLPKSQPVKAPKKAETYSDEDEGY